MNICILSMQRVNNYGSVLQAYALKKILEGLGHNVYFLDIERRDEDDKVVDNRLLFPNEQMFFWTTKKERIKALANKYFFIRAYHWFQTKQKNRRLQDFRIESLNVSKNKESYDACIIGSDEVFNALQNASWGFTGQLFGNVENVDKVITYAASCGATKTEMLNCSEKEIIKNGFRKISAFSVRDENTYGFVQSLSETEKIYRNFDPALVYDFNNEISNIALKLPSRYCLIYSYKNRIKDPNVIAKIREFCIKNKMKLVTVSDDQFWNYDYRPLTPFELLYAFKHSSFVITDTFHGTIFSAKYADRFAVITKDSNQNKLGDLIRKLNIQNHCLENITDLDRIFNTVKDKERIDGLLSQEMKNTQAYLNAYIG